MIAAFCFGEETQNFFCRIVISQSSLYRRARKISRFAQNDDTGQPSTRRDERGCEIARPPVSSSKAEPRDLNAIAAFCIGEETQKFFCRIVISQSLLYWCARKISRFARNDDMGGKNDDTGNDGMRRSGILISLPPQASCKLLSSIFTHSSFL